MKKLVTCINIIFLIIGILSIPVALTSFMVFDAPGSENNNYLWVAFWSALALPPTCLISILLSLYIVKRKNNDKLAVIISLLPCLVLALLCASLVMIQIFCDGNFSCGM